jgi:hypothetical protein
MAISNLMDRKKNFSTKNLLALICYDHESNQWLHVAMVVHLRIVGLAGLWTGKYD